MAQSGAVNALETKIPPPILWVMASAVTFLVDRLDLDDSLFGSSPVDGRTFDVIGIILAVTGLASAFAGGLRFSRAGTTVDPHRVNDATTLVTDGVYRFTRNPMYLGLALISIGWGLVLGTLVGLVVGTGALIVALTVLQIGPEERAMAATFGATYDDYRSKVRRWL